MQDVEIARPLIDALQHHHVQRIGIAHRAVEPQRPRPHGFKLGRGLRIAAGEQRHVVAERDQFLGQPGHDPLGATVKFGRDRLGQRRDLRDVHRIDLSSVWSRQGCARRPAISRRNDKNERRRKYFKSGVELIFRKPWNFFASAKSFQIHVLKPRVRDRSLLTCITAISIMTSGRALSRSSTSFSASAI